MDFSDLIIMLCFIGILNWLAELFVSYIGESEEGWMNWDKFKDDEEEDDE